MPTDTKCGVYYEVAGRGPNLVLAFPFLASSLAVLGADFEALRRRYLAALEPHFRVLCLDYPSIGRSDDIAPAMLTADRVCSDMLSVADAAGFERFAWWGYSWGAAVGLQLGWRSDRLSALVAGGWPALGGQYAAMLAASREQQADPPAEVQVILRSPAQYAQWATFYGSVQHWPEAEAAGQLQCPRLCYVGADGDTTAGSHVIRNASVLRAQQPALESLGWQVELLPGCTHESGLDPHAVLPVVLPFLERALIDES